MSNIGPIALENDESPADYDDKLADRIDSEVCKIINHCESVAKKIILDNRVIIDLVVEKLLDMETLDGEEFRELVRNYTVLPTKAI